MKHNIEVGDRYIGNLDDEEREVFLDLYNLYLEDLLLGKVFHLRNSYYKYVGISPRGLPLFISSIVYKKIETNSDLLRPKIFKVDKINDILLNSWYLNYFTKSNALIEINKIKIERLLNKI